MISPTNSNSEEESVIIAGAGPCGLFTALVLQRNNVPFIIIERASRDKLCANVGSGYDLTPTALRIMRHLRLPVDEHFSGYAGVSQLRMDGSKVRVLSVARDMGGTEIVSASRSDLQQLLIAALGDGIDLRCDMAVTGYREDAKGVVVNLSNGSTVAGRALLACDGVKSAVRAELWRDKADSLHYCGVDVWWGKCALQAGSRLEALLQETQVVEGGKSGVIYMGSGHHPGTFAVVPEPSTQTLLWVFSLGTKQESTGGDDLTRRGGVSGTAVKGELASHLQGRCELIPAIVEATLPENVTKVGLYDRTNLDLPFVSPVGRVALLGDAAHPQTPFCGQGLNMAITDAYICAMRLARQPLPVALRNYDTAERRKSSKAIVRSARAYAQWMMSRNPCVCWALTFMSKWAPVSFFIGDVLSKDDTNKAFLDAAKADMSLEV